MHFTIEQRLLADPSGKPVMGPTSLVSFHKIEAASADDAVRLFISRNPSEIVGTIVTFPGFHAVATVRNSDGVYTLQVSPTSGKMAPAGC